MHVGALTIVYLAAALAGTAVGLAVPHTHAVHERRRVPHPRINQRMSSDVLLPMRVGLKANAAALQSAEDWLMEVSHPASPKYGQHWTSAEVIEAFSPSSETIETVSAWLGESGIAKERITHSDNKAWFAFDVTVEEAERLLHTEFFHDGIEEDRGSMVGCNEYHLPKHIQAHVDYVTPGVKGTLMDLHPTSQWKRAAAKGHGAKRATSPSTPKHGKLMPKGTNLRDVDVVYGGSNYSLATCDELIIPECIQTLYNFSAPNPNATVSANNSLGIFEEGDFYSQPDFNEFFTTLTPWIPNGTHPIHDFIDGAEAPVIQALAGGESNLDFELAYPM